VSCLLPPATAAALKLEEIQWRGLSRCGGRRRRWLIYFCPDRDPDFTVGDAHDADETVNLDLCLKHRSRIHMGPIVMDLIRKERCEKKITASDGWGESGVQNFTVSLHPTDKEHAARADCVRRRVA
jgi:hypothetical protein